MWKYVSRRIRDTFERSVNHFDKRSSAGVVNTSGSVPDEKSKRSAPPCRWFCSRKCWGSFQGDNDTNSKRWNFEQLNRSWIGAITWSGALVVGWYTSQLIHLKLKYLSKQQKKDHLCNNTLLSLLHPYINCVNKSPVYLNSASQIEKVVQTFTPKVHFISNEQSEASKESSNSSGNTAPPEDNLGDVLNSIENKLGLAAIENGQHKDGLNLLRSAANRNHAPALYNLGLCYEMGLGVSINEKTAMELYRSAAALEHPGALYNLGVYYGQGRGGLTRDTDMATRLLRLAAVQGQKDAIEALKSLDIDMSEPPKQGEYNWAYHRCTPEENSIVPMHTTLFVENVNYLRFPNQATVY
ncbi:uncharacterized protein LOC126380649 [Pectinophora gossypiella]|uniref:uncharacterized protein LOC126380649 n=1 Tax=Pectinophora gossypiella TaxID=13191 RepID=UPI00214E04C9|nr:uncharacterized protein LOC126380649 [Pectinophora gossypiella]